MSVRPPQAPDRYGREGRPPKWGRGERLWGQFRGERGRGRGLARGGAPAPFLEGRGTAVWGESLGFWGLGVQGGGSARLGALTAFLRGKPAVWGEMLRFWGLGERAQLALDPTPRSCSDLG